MTIKHLDKIFVALAFLFVSACGPADIDPDEPGPGEMLRGDQALVRSDVPRAEPTLTPEELSAQVEGNTGFGFDLYQELRVADDDNLFLSPLSISVALGMTHAGARGNTAAEMSGALRFVLGGDRHHEAFNAIDLALSSRGEGAQGSDDGAFRLNINNAIWGQDGFAIETPFLDLLASQYDAGLRVLDFMSDPETSREIINEWVSFHTEEKIPELLGPGTITELTRLVLTNTVYFNAGWKHELDDGTRNAAFTRLDGAQVQAETMHKLAGFGYASRTIPHADAGFEVVELPYDGDELSMVILLPEEGSFLALEQALDSSLLADALAAVETLEVDLALPKFTFSSKSMLRQHLEALGMYDAFDPGAADLTGITGAIPLYISAVVHEAFIDVHEKGTEAAAATGVVVGTTSAPHADVVVRVDRPFVFLIRDIETGTIVFLGRVTDPTA